jgi:hypothetical protein
MKKYLPLYILSALLVMAALVLMTGTLGCDSGDRQEQTTTMPVDPADQPAGSEGMTSSLPPVSEIDLEKAAVAYNEITRINEDLQQAVQQTQDAEERQKLQLSANEKMVRAAENAGLDFETYNRIMQTVRSDQQMEMLFQQKLKALQ